MDTKFTSLFFKMKRFKNTVLLFCCFAFTTQLCEAQPYEPLAVPGESSWRLWSMSTMYAKIFASEPDTATSMVKLMEIPNMDTANSILYGFVRQDSAYSKAWFKPADSVPEYLIYDMELTVGDSFDFKLSLEDSGMLRLGVDSVYFEEGRKHIRFDYNVRHNLPLYMVEGVGATSELSTKIDTQYRRNLICAWKLDELLYEVEIYSDCELIYSVNPHEAPNPEVKVYPNPTRNEIRIAGDQSEQFKDYRILSIDGRLVKSGRLNNEKVIQAGELSPGLYVVVLLHDEGSITCKIVIE